MEGFDGSLVGWVTGSLSELWVKPVSFWTNSLKEFVSAWTKVVGACMGDDIILVLCLCLSIFYKKRERKKKLKRIWAFRVFVRERLKRKQKLQDCRMAERQI